MFQSGQNFSLWAFTLINVFTKWTANDDWDNIYAGSRLLVPFPIPRTSSCSLKVKSANFKISHSNGLAETIYLNRNL